MGDQVGDWDYVGSCENLRGGFQSPQTQCESQLQIGSLFLSCLGS